MSFVLPSKKMMLRLVFGIVIFGCLFFVAVQAFNLWRAGSIAATQSCLASIASAFQKSDQVSLLTQSVETEWQNLREEDRLMLLSELKSTHGLDCGRAVKSDYRDLWGTPINLSIRKEPEDSDVLALQVRSVGPDREKSTMDDMVFEGRRKGEP